MSNGLPAFTPVQPVIARPVQPPAPFSEQSVGAGKPKKPSAAAKGKKTVAANKKALAKVAAKFSDNKAELPLTPVGPDMTTPLAAPAKRPRKPRTTPLAAPARKPHKAKAASAKRQRTMRIAPMQMDASTALSAMLELSKKDLAAMAKMVELLNPLSRPARLKMLSALLKVAHQ